MKSKEEFKTKIQKVFKEMYRQQLSESTKRGIRARKIRLSTQKVDM